VNRKGGQKHASNISKHKSSLGEDQKKPRKRDKRKREIRKKRGRGGDADGVRDRKDFAVPCRNTTEGKRDKLLEKNEKNTRRVSGW